MSRFPKSPHGADVPDDEITEITHVDELAGGEDDEDNVLRFRPVTDRRRHPRFDARLTAVVYTATGSFRTQTANVSEGGLKLGDRLPAEFRHVGLEVLMIAEKADGPFEYYLFKAKAVGPHDDGHRLQFTWVPAQTLTPYRELLRRLETGAGGIAA